ncbi:MAG: DUF4276 family protein [Calditrichaeota bacterium]|nr:MAG: DUF4276 family protein [Calditrichota bacterium]
MSKQVIIGFTTEGKTDVQFLESVIQRSFEDVAFECDGEIEVLPVQYLEKQSGSFIEAVKKYAQQAEEMGIMVLCIHADADAATDINTFKNKIYPAFTAVSQIIAENVCKNLVAIVPIQMTEAWMLSDKELLKAEIGTSKSDAELGIQKSPEVYPDPKQVIEMAIRIARQDLTRRYRRKLTIAELYSLMGQKIALNKLKNLSSYQKFKEAVRDAFKSLNYLH